MKDLPIKIEPDKPRDNVYMTDDMIAAGNKRIEVEEKARNEALRSHMSGWKNAGAPEDWAAKAQLEGLKNLMSDPVLKTPSPQTPMDYSTLPEYRMWKAALEKEKNYSPYTNVYQG